ncbi:hypothetical protein EYF80_034398 [Liparis tanakae]|uniref:Uncharacterized protein n=1 Tax=Liparis tanakae TaxID=230148 RepID=A0A4Z2GPI8_9TELE|nr:hypothetical protein EYF80_034398 [Liparis tanakae]
MTLTLSKVQKRAGRNSEFRAGRVKAGRTRQQGSSHFSDCRSSQFVSSDLVKVPHATGMCWQKGARLAPGELDE